MFCEHELAIVICSVWTSDEHVNEIVSWSDKTSDPPAISRTALIHHTPQTRVDFITETIRRSMAAFNNNRPVITSDSRAHDEPNTAQWKTHLLRSVKEGSQLQ